MDFYFLKPEIFREKLKPQILINIFFLFFFLPTVIFLLWQAVTFYEYLVSNIQFFADNIFMETFQSV